MYGLISGSKAKVKGMYFVKKKNKGKQLQHNKKDRKKKFRLCNPSPPRLSTSHP